MEDLGDRLTPLQRIILEIEQLGLSRRDSIKLASQRADFFVGQEKYEDELRKIRRLQAAQERAQQAG